MKDETVKKLRDDLKQGRVTRITTTKAIVEPAKYPMICMDCANHLIMDQRLLIESKECERLKKLEEENKKLLGALNSIGNRQGKSTAFTFTVEEINRLQRLEENVKKKIEDTKKVIEWEKKRFGETSLTINNIILKVLESLDK